ncbi:uncharacterized protein B0I36DRAFT_314612 [Microdochium trichocladiopsis]|uniref:Vacuolar ATPase assembly protein VMA22 n=1 Tax=Microdochium trichocladiopsis TaxID=1682393 RepID=A0A9P8YEZ4_9PEZI|nr:uncharacterized protein B0I36DRAFT_314612 [Microdochium trichocladiopsis]KAH7037687.1 hypothetical protein B0I36DRAFT_314612 [Microdochium trichocladiopsis]
MAAVQPLPISTGGASHDEAIEMLLERYLHLLDEYTSLRSELSKLQSAMYQQLARANFAAERGIWYGQDYYDERMQASSTVVVSGTSSPRFSVVRRTKADTRQSKTAGSPDSSALGGAAVGAGYSRVGDVSHPTVPPPNHQTVTVDSATEGQHREAIREENTSVEHNRAVSADLEGSADTEASPGAESDQKEKESRPMPADPIRWFGLMAPMALRQAQACSSRAVNDIVPRLATVSVEMAEVEIKVRRARKRRAKAASSTANSIAETFVTPKEAVAAQ